MESPAERQRLLDEAVDGILEEMASRGNLLVAFSGGVDSALVARLAGEALGRDALAVTAASESMASHELESARATAREIGIRHRVIRYSDLVNADYVANTSDRCFHCRHGMASHLLEVAEEEGMAHLADGVIVDDLGDFRPGMAAMDASGFWHPLMEAGFGKGDVRTVARRLGLSVHGRPSNACLSSRIRRGTPVTLELLRRIESGEEILRDLGFRQVRVRAVDGGARVEVGRSEVPRLLRPPVASRVIQALQDVGFAHVELDPQGYRTGTGIRLTTP
jgi:uncharacterized protein